MVVLFDPVLTTSPPTVEVARSFDLILRFLDTNGNGTGDTSGVGDFSVNERELFIEPPPGEVFILNRLVVTVRDGGTQA